MVSQGPERSLRNALGSGMTAFDIGDPDVEVVGNIGRPSPFSEFRATGRGRGMNVYHALVVMSEAEVIEMIRALVDE